MSRGGDIDELLGIMRRLRDPEGGCPWDLQQDFRSVAPYTLEEAFEVVDAIEREDLGELRDELGDLLLQVVFHARMAEEAGAFAFADVVGAICEKMVRRHPHVFGDVEHRDETALRRAWEDEKARERAARRGDAEGSLMDGVARALPALVRAEKVQRRAARAGFDWERARPVLGKIREETEECARALDGPPQALEAEIGDLLFSCVNFARHCGVDAEQALRGAAARFEGRFRYVEAGLRRAELAPTAAARETMERLWEEAKAAGL